MDWSCENRTVTLQRNPLLINTVTNCFFEYLPVKDLKQCRAVCQEWNSLSMKILNERSAVKLDSKERVTNFQEFYNDYNTQTFPFTNFDLKFSYTERNTEEYEQLLDLFNNLRENIRTLSIEHTGDKLCVNQLIDIATNLVQLKLYSYTLVVALDKLSKVKHLVLLGCKVSLDSFENRIDPSSISLHYVTFERNGNGLQEMIINDYIDFSRCSDIEVTSSKVFSMTFDMSRDIVSARKVTFEELKVINWRNTPSRSNRKMLIFENNTGMGMKEFDFRSSELSLSVLPKSLEKLSLSMNTYSSINCGTVDLPNLKYLLLQKFQNATNKMSPTAYDMGIITSMFRCCPKLVDLELCGWYISASRCDINVAFLPLNLKRIKLADNNYIDLVGDAVTHVDTLILEPGTFADAQKFMNKIKPKILVVELETYTIEEPCNEIVSFVEESRNLEKIVIKIPEEGNNQIIKSYGRTLLRYVNVVDRAAVSKYYEFTNQVGKHLTREEFNMYWF